MYVCMYVWKYVCMDGWKYVCMDGWMDGWMYGCMYVWDVGMYVCMDGWMDGRMDDSTCRVLRSCSIGWHGLGPLAMSSTCPI